MDLGKLIRPEVLAQKAYPAEIATCRIKMDANENPYRLPPSLQEKLFARMQDTALNRYPDPGAPALRKRFGAACGVDENWVMTGNGSDEIIQILCASLARPGAKLLVPTPTFVMYRIIGLNCGLDVMECPLDDAFDLDLAAMLRKIAAEFPALIFLSYPNSPTGNCFSEDRIRAILEASTGLVVVDEAYGNFSGKTFLPQLKRYQNLVILRTLSKVGYAALRIGFLLSAPALLLELNKVRLPYNLNSLSQIAAGFFLDEEQAFLEQINRIVEERKKLYNALRAIDGIYPYPSVANFIFFSCTQNANHVYEQILRKGILVKPFIFPWINRQFIRVTVGSREENETFIEALKRVITK
jgi:histidinol-phosphate aminotransferase